MVMMGTGGGSAPTHIDSLLALVTDPAALAKRLNDLKVATDAADERVKTAAEKTKQADELLSSAQLSLKESEEREDAIDAAQIEISKKSDVLAHRERALASRESALVKAQNDLGAIRVTFEAEKTAHNTELTALRQRQEALIEAARLDRQKAAKELSAAESLRAGHEARAAKLSAALRSA